MYKLKVFGNFIIEKILRISIYTPEQNHLYGNT